MASYQHMRSGFGIMYLSLRMLPFLLMGLAFFGRSTNAIKIVNVTAIPGSTKDLVMGTNTSVVVSGYACLTQEEIKLDMVLCSQVADLKVARPLHQICNNQTLDIQPASSLDQPCSKNTAENLTSNLYFFNGSFSLYGVLLGRTNVKIYITEDNSEEKGPQVMLIEKYSVTVIRKPRFLDHLFTGTIIIFVIFINIGFGCMIDMKVIKEILRKPVVPLLGLCCQYIINPLVSMCNQSLFLNKSLKTMFLH